MAFNTIDPLLPFFDVYPELKIAVGFKDLVNDDLGSKKAWCVLLCNHRSSQYFNLSDEDKKELLAKEFLGNARFFNSKVFTKLSEIFNSLYETPARKALRELEVMLTDRSNFIKDNPYSEDTWEMLEKMNASTLKIFENYDKARRLVEQEDAKDKAMGDEMESLSDQGLI